MARHERGYFHLTPDGWVRTDGEPFPPNRIETWDYQLASEADDAKEQVRLDRVWKAPASEAYACLLRERFGDPVLPTTLRNVLMGCQV